LPQATLGYCERRKTYREAVMSFPNVTFIPLDAVPLQQQTQFILKVDFLVVLRLPGDIPSYLFDI
jgi:hypothetical protein